MSHADVTLLPGTDRLLSRLDLWVPFHGQERALWYIDARAVVSSRHNYEGNLGIGYRRMLDSAPWILGAYAFYDRRWTEYRNVFNQATLGLEALSEQWDIRANLYLPELGRQRAETSGSSGGSSAPRLSGNQIVSGSGQLTQSYEKAMRGFDLELGRSVPRLPWLRTYAAGFAFNASGTPGATGVRFRLEARMTDRLTLGARYQRDDLRGSQGFLEFRLRLDSWRGPNKRPGRYSLAERMTQKPERDIDIVTSDKATSLVGSPTTPLLGGDGNTQEVWYVNNNAAAGGSGTFENPFDTLAEAEAASGPYDWIFVYAGDGSTTGQAAGITLQANQKLLGEGVGLTASSTALIAAGSRPVLTGTAAGGATVVVADNAEVAGVQVSNAAAGGIGAAAVNGVNIHDNVVATAGSYGVGLINAGGTVSIQSNTVTAALVGVVLGTTNASTDLNATVSSNTISGSTAAEGIGVSNSSTTRDSTITISSNIVSANAGSGIVASATGSRTLTTTISNNSSTGDDTGIGLVTSGSSNAVLRATLSGNTITNPVQEGILLSTSGSTNATTLGATITSDTVTGTPTKGGLKIDTRGTADVDIVTTGSAFGGGGNASTNDTSNLCLELSSSSANPSWAMTNTAGSFNLYFDAGSNTPTTYNTTGTITVVPQTTCTP